MDLQPQPTSRRLKLLYSPLLFTVQREFNYAISFLFLLISTIALFTLLTPLEPHSLFSFDFRSYLLPKCAPPPQTCDYSLGRWVWDESSPSSLIYDENCPFLDPGFRCLQNGRKDVDYRSWRWQPHGCDLPSFNASNLLERTRNGRIVFAGDSIGRNQWESLICMLSKAVPNVSSIYEVNRKPISKHKGYLSMRFQDYNLTVEYYRAPFLVRIGKPPLNSPSEVRSTVKVDELHLHKKRWVGADVLVFNSGHWWNQDKTVTMGWYFQEEGKINMSMSVSEAFRRSMLTWKSWVMKKIDLDRSHVFFRSYSPVHYSGGKWNEGGRCSADTKPETNYTKLEPESIYNLHISDAIKEMGDMKNKVRFLNITFLTDIRKDGHPSNHRQPDTPAESPQDCSHWCLPGVPDTWNQILYAHLLADGFRKK